MQEQPLEAEPDMVSLIHILGMCLETPWTDLELGGAER